MTRRPPHILVTTPESLYLLLTSDGRPRDAVGRSRTVIVDEIHALVSRQTRQPPRPLARAPRGTRRPALAAHRPLRHAEADRGRRAVSRGNRPRVPHRGRRELPRARHRDRDPALAALDRLLARAVGGDLRPHRRARARAPHDAGLRQHAQDGRAPRRQALRAPRRRRGHEPPRQPLAGAPPRRRGAPQGRAAARPRRHRVARARHRHRRRGPGLQIGATRSIATFLQRIGRSGHALSRVPEGTALPPDPRRARRERGARVLRPDAACSTGCPHLRPRSTSSPSRPWRRAWPRNGRRTSSSTRSRGRGRIATCRAPTSTRSCGCTPGGRQALLHRDGVGRPRSWRRGARG